MRRGHGMAHRDHRPRRDRRTALARDLRPLRDLKRQQRILDGEGKARDQFEQAAAIGESGRNPRHLTGVDLGPVRAVPLEAAPGDVDVVVVAVPSRAFAGVAADLPGEAPVLSLTKGLDPATGARLSTRVRDRSVAVLSGPNVAEEIAVGMPTAAVIASDDGYLAG